jgi:general L-amino acid transport system substrate-binding protein
MTLTKRLLPLILLLALFAGLKVQAQDITPTPLPQGPTLNSILARGQVNCGVNQDLPGFGYLDPNTGLVAGFDVDFCRALGAAIFGDSTAAATVLLSSDQAISALQNGDVDVLFHNMVWELSSEEVGLQFGPPNYYNGQTLMVRADSGLDDWPALSGMTICITAGSTAETRLPAAMRERNLTYQLVILETFEAARDALAAGQCDAQSADRVRLEALRQDSNDPEGFQVWQGDQVYTREPFAPLYRYGDQQWANIVNWTVLGLIAAEQYGVNSENINDLARLPEETPEAYQERVGPEVAALLDTSFSTGETTFGLNPSFMVDVIREVGNYGEIYNRSLGSETGALQLQRNLNNLWQNGGLLYAPDWG